MSGLHVSAMGRGYCPVSHYHSSFGGVTQAAASPETRHRSEDEDASFMIGSTGCVRDGQISIPREQG
jgi:hypothetical protein